MTFDILPNQFLPYSFMIPWQARQSLIVRGLFPMLADPRHPVRIISSQLLLLFFICAENGIFCIDLNIYKET